MSPTRVLRMTWIGVILLALVLVPAPLLPPHWLAEAIQSALGIGWKAAYLVAATGLHTLFYGSLGMLASLAVERAPTVKQRLVQMLTVPLIVVGVALIVRTVKLGHLPMFANAAVPMVACFAGAGLGLGLLYRKWKLSLALGLVLTVSAFWALLGRPPTELSRATESNLQRLVKAAPSLPAGEAKFGGLWQAAFAPGPTNSPLQDAVQENRAAILALGIAAGHERLARLAGVERNSPLVREAAALRQGLTIRGREDWARHYALSAALAVLDHPLVSDAGGLLKEQLDALTGGSGFSFGDLAADRAGVRFAEVATRSESDAEAIQQRIRSGFSVDDFFPNISDLPEGLTVEQFRAEYGGVGSARYRDQVREIETRLSQCAALSVL